MVRPSRPTCASRLPARKAGRGVPGAGPHVPPPRRRLGQAAGARAPPPPRLLVEMADRRILVDPGNFSSGFENLTDLDAILVTHNHPDHFDPEPAARLIRANPRPPSTPTR